MRPITVVLVLIVAAFLCAGAAAQAPPSPGLKDLTQQAAERQGKLAKARDPVEKKRLANELETLKHRMGPVDADGKPVRPSAMWHAQTLESLEAEIRRLTETGTGAAASTPGTQGRLHARRMAAACLGLGWAAPDGAAKYQADAFGAYLANNLAALDALFRDLDASGHPPGKPDAPPPDDATGRALAQAKDGLKQMADAADAVAKAPVPEPKDLPTSLGLFVKGFRTAQEAGAAVRAARGTAPGPASAAKQAAPAPIGPGTFALTAEQKGQLAKIRQVAAGLQDEAWLPIRKCLEEYAQAAEQGLQVGSVRAKSLDMLVHTHMAAQTIEGIHQPSRLVPPGYAETWRERLQGALLNLKGRDEWGVVHKEIQGKFHLEKVCRALEESPVSVRAAQGYLFTYDTRNKVLAPLFPNVAHTELISSDRFWRDARDNLLGLLGRTNQWPPKDMPPPLKQLYAAHAAIFIKTVEDTGRLCGSDLQAAIPRTREALGYGKDLERLVRAAQVLRTVPQRVPACAKVLSDCILKDAADMVKDPKNRNRFDDLIKPLETMERLGAIDPKSAPAAARIGGPPYKVALALLNRQMTQGVEAVCKGDSKALGKALEPVWMFDLLRWRAQTESPPLNKINLANLIAFSVPETTWKQYLKGLDRSLQAAFAEYADRAASPTVTPPLAAGEELCGLVLKVQEMTLDAAGAGSSDLDLLLINLGQVAGADPPEPAWHAWAVGHHLTEAAASASAGFDETAAWHSNQIRTYSKWLTQP